MRPTVLQTLTWATVAAAVASALWLAAIEPDPVATLRLTALPAALMSLVRPSEPPAADARDLNKSPSSRQPQRQR